MERTGAPPPLTIGLPVYNGAEYLAGSMDSLLEQTYGDWVLLISDNASSDETQEICREYADQDDRIRYSRQDKNMGGAFNFSSVALRAESPMFKWMTHDDIMQPAFLERCVTTLTDAPDSVMLAYTRSLLIDADGAVIRDFDDGLDLRDPEPHRRLRKFLENYEMSNPIFSVFRTSDLLKTSLLRSYVSSDKVLMAEMAMIGQFWEIPDRLFYRRYHEGMSRQANVTPEEIAAWFDPNTVRPIQMERSKVFMEYVKAINSRRIPLSPSERLRCMRELFSVSGLHEARVIGGEVKREAKVWGVRTRNRLKRT